MCELDGELGYLERVTVSLGRKSHTKAFRSSYPPQGLEEGHTKTLRSLDLPRGVWGLAPQEEGHFADLPGSVCWGLYMSLYAALLFLNFLIGSHCNFE
jgi:hypothetical protein